MAGRHQGRSRSPAEMARRGGRRRPSWRTGRACSLLALCSVSVWGPRSTMAKEACSLRVQDRWCQHSGRGASAGSGRWRRWRHSQGPAHKREKQHGRPMSELRTAVARQALRSRWLTACTCPAPPYGTPASGCVASAGRGWAAAALPTLRVAVRTHVGAHAASAASPLNPSRLPGRHRTTDQPQNIAYLAC